VLIVVRANFRAANARYAQRVEAATVSPVSGRGIADAAAD